jgi:MFS family permease
VLSGLIGICGTAWQVGVLRAGAWAARGLRVPARNALLADAVPAGVYGRAYGFERAMDNLGAIGGPLLALGLVAAFSVRTAILLSIIPGLLAALAIVYAIRHLPRLSPRAREPIRLWVRPVLQGRLGALMLAVAAFEFGNIAATLLILRASDLLSPDHGADAATKIALVLYAGYNLAATLVSVPAGHVGDRRGQVGVMAGGVMLFGAAYLLLAVTGASVALLLLGFLLAGVGIGCVETAEHAAVATLAPQALRVLWSLVSPTAAFAYAAAWMALAQASFLGLRARRRSGLHAGALGVG